MINEISCDSSHERPQFDIFQPQTQCFFTPHFTSKGRQIPKFHPTNSKQALNQKNYSRKSVTGVCIKPVKFISSTFFTVYMPFHLLFKFMQLLRYKKANQSFILFHFDFSSTPHAKVIHNLKLRVCHLSSATLFTSTLCQLEHTLPSLVILRFI